MFNGVEQFNGVDKLITNYNWGSRYLVCFLLKYMQVIKSNKVETAHIYDLQVRESVKIE